MKLEDVLGLLVPVTWFVGLWLETLFPARTFPRVRAWRWLGLAFMVVLMAFNVVLPSLLPVDWIARHALLDGADLGLFGGAVVGVLLNTLLGYAWHRLEHGLGFTWRWFHQLHHSPVRVDIAGSAYTHPLEMLQMVLTGLTVNVLILGLDPGAAALAGYIGAFLAMFQHLNVRTPRGLGWFVQRPESHCLHHERGVHARNYGDLPLWDLLFGTFANPAGFEGEVGFSGESPRRLGAMLRGVDVERSAR